MDRFVTNRLYRGQGLSAGVKQRGGQATLTLHQGFNSGD